MQRPRFLVLAGSLAVALAVVPVLGAAVLAADPTVVVRPGDTLTGLSRRHSVSVADLVRFNGLRDPNRIVVGQTLRVGTEAPPSAPAAAAPAPAAVAAQVHVVQGGENLTTIARHYGVSIGAVVAANGIANPSRIFGGQRLTIPGTAPSAPAAPAPAPAGSATPAAPAASASRVHVVQRGENLTSIARHYGVNLAAIVAANGIANPSRIFGGQQLTIPGSAPAAPAAAAPAAIPMPRSMAALVASRAAVRQVIAEEAARYGVPAAFALAVAWQESGWQQSVVSSAGAIGIMQLMPATAVWVGEAMLGAPVNTADTRENVRAGVRLLAHYLARYDGNRDLVLAAYYQGQSAVDRHGVYPVSRPYIASIRILERIFEG